MVSQGDEVEQIKKHWELKNSNVLYVTKAQALQHYSY